MLTLPFRAPPSPGSEEERIGVIDIGSNSIRLVIYDALKRASLPIFNEKSMCGLGRGLARTGRLHPDGIQQGLAALARFRQIADGIRVGRIDLLATAAVRDADDGPEFIAAVETVTGQPVQIVAGEQEARLAALGVLSGTPEARGLVGDLGGGSLELVRIENHQLANQVTLPLGPLRLMDMGGVRQGALIRHIDEHIQGQAWLTEQRGGDFYAVGGAWRSLAKLHMEQSNHPLHIIHNYAIEVGKAREFAAQTAVANRQMLERSPATRRRADTIPHAALVLERLLRFANPGRVVFSAFGLREGHLFSLLGDDERRRDPLIAACDDLARMSGRPVPADALFAWTNGLLAGEDEAARRLREASCHLCEIAWAEHPDYRAELAFLRVLRYPFPGVDHIERVFLALTAHARYGGGPDTDIMARSRTLLSDGQAAKAQILGLALRLAHTLTGGADSMLRRTALKVLPEELVLVLPADGSVPGGEVVERRHGVLAGALNRTARIDRGPRVV